MNTNEMQTAFIRINKQWPGFSTSLEATEEWRRAFGAVPTELFYKALDLYIQTKPWQPKISDIFNLTKQFSVADPNHQSSKSYAVNPSLDDKWRYLLMQLDKGLAYCRELHPQGWIIRWVPIKQTGPCGIIKGRALKVGLWTHGAESTGRYIDPYSDLPEASIGEGESWVFGYGT